MHSISIVILNTYSPVATSTHNITELSHTSICRAFSSSQTESHAYPEHPPFPSPHPSICSLSVITDLTSLSCTSGSIQHLFSYLALFCLPGLSMLKHESDFFLLCVESYSILRLCHIRKEIYLSLDTRVASSPWLTLAMLLGTWAHTHLLQSVLLFPWGIYSQVWL